jgi:hypothetical protein
LPKFDARTAPGNCALQAGKTVKTSWLKRPVGAAANASARRWNGIPGLTLFGAGYAFVLCGFLLLFSVAHAQQNAATPGNQPDLQTKLDAALAKNADLEKIISILNADVDALKSPDEAALRKAQLAHSIATMNQIEAVYNWQMFASNVSLGLVSIIVFAGVLFAGFQLWQAARVGQPQAESQLEVSASNFRITSSTVGVIVLALSFLFFYLFVKEIYAVTPPAEVLTNATAK